MAISMHASAGPIINGREWYQPQDVINYSWDDFYAICSSGICIGQIGGTGPDLTGWVWASIYEVGDLFHATTPHPGGIASYTDDTPFQSPSWAWSFLNIFNHTYYDTPPLSGAVGVFGLTSTKDDVSGTPLWGMVGYYISGWIAPGVPEVDGTVRTEQVRAASPDDRIGAWLYRYDPTLVPVPATNLLVVFALVGLAWSRRTVHQGAGSLVGVIKSCSNVGVRSIGIRAQFRFGNPNKAVWVEYKSRIYPTNLTTRRIQVWTPSLNPA